MRSPVMNRFCDREFDVCEEINNPAKDAMAGNLIASQKVEKETKLDLTKLSTQKGVRARVSAGRLQSRQLSDDF